MIKIETNTGKAILISALDFPVKILDVDTVEGLKDYRIDRGQSGKVQMTAERKEIEQIS